MKKNLLLSFQFIFLAGITSNLAQIVYNLTKNSLGMGWAVTIVVLIFAMYIAFSYKQLSTLLFKIPFSIAIVSTLALGTAIGTLVLQNLVKSGYINHYGETITELIYYCNLNDVFHSWWWNSLVFLLVAALLRITFRKKIAKKNTGFLMTHLGLIVILTGVWIDFFFGTQGLIDMIVGEKTKHFMVFDRNTNRKIGDDSLDFEIQLDRFETEQHEASYKIRVWKRSLAQAEKGAPLQAQQPKQMAALPIEVGRTEKLHNSEITYVVKEYYPSFEYKYMKEDPEDNSEDNPVMLGMFFHGKDSSEFQFGTSEDGMNQFISPNNDFVLRFDWKSKDLEDYIKEKKIFSPHVITIQFENGRALDLVVKAGQEIEITDNIKIKVEESYTHLALKEDKSGLYNASDELVNPALKINLLDKGNKNDIYLFSNLKDLVNDSTKALYNKLELSLTYQYTPLDRFYILGSENMIYHFADGDLVSGEEIISNKRYVLPTHDSMSFKVNYIFGDELNIKKVPVKTGDELTDPAALVEVTVPGLDEPYTQFMTEPKGSKEGLLMIPNSMYFLELRSLSDEETKTWKSKLTIIEDGEEVNSKTVEVNDPLIHNGFRFYQTNFDPERPNYSGIGLSYEPGVKIMYSGFFILVIGIYIMFYVQDTKKKN